MIRAVSIILGAALLFAAAGDLRRILALDGHRTEYSDACDYYQTRSGQVQRDGPGEFTAFLATACIAAERSMESGTPEQRIRAELFLSRIALLRQTIDRMNADRDARAMALLDEGSPYTAVMLYRVTPSGEFLIAHRMGLMIAFDAWLDSGADFSLASYP